ncbi:translation elongation factor Ts [Inquilinus sp.]|uniref:translation elongation factor Ts n=1 Tax=Inquilinus sp. TaxID=1932117 RepID=UPI0031DAE015
MAEITAALVKELREKTGAGMMDCKKALNEAGGDLEAAVDWLRKKGLAAAAKKAGRVAAEGLVGAAVEGNRGALVEVNSETDFVSRNDKFQGLVSTLAGLALQANGDVAALAASAYPGTGRTAGEEVTQMVATIGENISLRRSAALSVSNGVVAAYVHSPVSAGLGKIGVLVAVESTGDKAKLEAFGKQVAMHIAAARPDALHIADVDAANLERERAVLVEQARASGKPEAIIEKMVEGRIRKYYEEVVLHEQVWVLDGETKVRAAIEAAAKDAGAPVTVTGFVRFVLGEGIEKEQGDFAAEVAATLGR